MIQYWLADSEARVLGPVGINVIRDLASRGKLSDIRAVSKDGRNFVPLREMPELYAELNRQAREDERDRSQAQAAQEIRNWISAVRERSTSEIFRVPPSASKAAWRAAFFPLIFRYVPGRLPPDATAELRLACEDAFLFLAERMIDIERQFHTASRTPPPFASSLTPAKVSWSGGMLHVRLMLRKNEAQPFTISPDANWKTDCLFVQSSERVLVSTPTEVTITLEGQPHGIQSTGRVISTQTTPPEGFSVKLLDLTENDRSIVRSWVSRAVSESGEFRGGR